MFLWVTMPSTIDQLIQAATGSTVLSDGEIIQQLWSGYGHIARYLVADDSIGSVIVKHIDFAAEKNHPRGWNSALAHHRKLHSYRVEAHWYRNWSDACQRLELTRVATCLGVYDHPEGLTLILEDLDSAGFDRRLRSVTDVELDACLRWLAAFHAIFIQQSPTGLWPVGTYWHLDTRPDEWEALDDGALKKAAASIDRLLRNCRYQTFVHGDAKLANFCFSANGDRVAAVDFQYIGGGCGMKDVAYFLGSCLDEEHCRKLESHCLDLYFDALAKALNELHKAVDIQALENEWRALYPLAWADFHRFLKGWCPDHHKLNRYSEAMTQTALARLVGD